MTDDTGRDRASTDPASLRSRSADSLRNSPTVSEPRTPTGKWLADQLHDDATAFLAITSGRFSIGNTATKVIDAIPKIESEAAQPINVEGVVSEIVGIGAALDEVGRRLDRTLDIFARLRALDTDHD